MMQLRLTCAIFAIGSLACGGVSNAVDGGPDAPTDTSPVDGAADAPLDTSGGSPLTVTTYGPGGPANTQLVAFQDGDGPWTAVSGTGGVYSATLQSDRYGVMTSCLYSTFRSGLFIVYGAVSDGTKLYLPDCEEWSENASVNISGSVTGAAPANPVVILTTTGDVDVPAGASSYRLAMEAGPAKLIAEELANARPVKLAMVDAHVVDGARVNFDLATGFAPVTHSLTANRNVARAQSGFRDVHGILTIERATAPFNSLRYVPADRLGSGLNRLSVNATDGTIVIRYFRDAADQNITFPVALQLAQQPTATATPYPNVQLTIPSPAEGSDYSFRFGAANATTSITQDWSVSMTSAWLEKASTGATAFAYTIPDFRGLAGWHSGFQIATGLPLTWSMERRKSKRVDWILAVPPGTSVNHDGSEIQLSSASGELAAP